MEVILEILGAIVAFLIEVTIHALVFLYLLVMAVFSPTYREKLRTEWDTSTGRRITLVIGVCFYSAALIIALCVWIPLAMSDHGDEKSLANEPDNTIEFTRDEVETMKSTRTVDELVDVAGGIIKRKLEENQSAEQDAAPN